MNLTSTKLACFAALCAIAAAPAARAGVDAHSYVQKGLVACYDGIDNAGTGTHDPTAATWADLSSNGFDGTLAANLGWAADGWTNAVDGSGAAAQSSCPLEGGTRTFVGKWTARP